MRRKLSQYANCTARAVSDGSPAQVFNFVEDAKHDIAELAAENDRLRKVIIGAIGEIRLMATAKDCAEGQHRQFYQGVNAARDTLEIYFRRYADLKPGAPDG
jgi:hypothetical protein